MANNGSETISLAGYQLHDDGDKHRVSLGQFGAHGSGQALRILTGPDAAASDGAVVWTR